MKKKWMGIILMCCVLALSGCGGKKSSTKENRTNIHDKKGQDMFPVMASSNPEDGAEESGEILDNEGDLSHELDIRYELSAMLPFTEGDDKICAIAYMGNTGEAQETNLTAFYQKYFPNLDSSCWTELSDIQCGGSECFLVIPRYKETFVYVNTLWENPEGVYEVVLSDAVKQEAFLLYCSVTPEYTNTEVYMNYNNSMAVVVPRFNATDGRMEQLQVALDLTMDEVYR